MWSRVGNNPKENEKKGEDGEDESIVSEVISDRNQLLDMIQYGEFRKLKKNK